MVSDFATLKAQSRLVTADEMWGVHRTWLLILLPLLLFCFFVVCSLFWVLDRALLARKLAVCDILLARMHHVPDGANVVKKKTMMGGLFCVLWFIAFFVILGALFSPPGLLN